MPRKYFFSSDQAPYYLTAHCREIDWYGVPLKKVWSIMGDYLYFISKAYSIQIHGFVLLPRQFHLLISCPEMNLSKAMNYFMRETSKAINFESGRINQVYGGRFERCLILSEHGFKNCYKFLYRTPLTSPGQRAETYKYSSLPGLLGESPLPIPVTDPFLFAEDFQHDVLRWLNTPPNLENDFSMKRALRKNVFGFSRNPRSGYRNVLETELL